jgi:hypothetical protein
MTLKDSERRLLHEILQEVRPYIAEARRLEELVDRQIEFASSISGFMTQIENEGDITNNSILRTDLRIYLARLRKRAK